MFALDIEPVFLQYSRMKCEKGEITWICGNMESIPLRTDTLDVTVAGELIEHCAYPEDIVSEILRCTRPGGYVIITTPNGARVMKGLPTFAEVCSKEERRVFEGKQFLPDGKGHLFLFKLEEIPMIVPKGAQIVGSGYLGGTVLVNEYSILFLKLLPVR